MEMGRHVGGRRKGGADYSVVLWVCLTVKVLSRDTFLSLLIT